MRRKRYSVEKRNRSNIIRLKNAKIKQKGSEIQIFIHGLYHSDNGEKFGAKFIELVQKAMAEYDESK